MTDLPGAAVANGSGGSAPAPAAKRGIGGHVMDITDACSVARITRSIAANGATSSSNEAFKIQPLPTFKIIVLGDAAVGKSNILTRFADDRFDRNSKATLGIEFFSREIELPHETIPGETRHVIAQLWDTAGQERGGSITSAYYRNAVGVVVVYDITRPESLRNVTGWMERARQFVRKVPSNTVATAPGADDEDDCVYTVIGNKADLTHSPGCVTLEEAETVCHSLNARHFTTSALTGEGILSALLSVILSVNAIQSLKRDAEAEAFRSSIANPSPSSLFSPSFTPSWLRSGGLRIGSTPMVPPAPSTGMTQSVNLSVVSGGSSSIPYRSADYNGEGDSLSASCRRC